MTSSKEDVEGAGVGASMRDSMQSFVNFNGFVEARTCDTGLNTSVHGCGGYLTACSLEVLQMPKGLHRSAIFVGCSSRQVPVERITGPRADLQVDIDHDEDNGQGCLQVVGIEIGGYEQLVVVCAQCCPSLRQDAENVGSERDVSVSRGEVKDGQTGPGSWFEVTWLNLCRPYEDCLVELLWRQYVVFEKRAWQVSHLQAACAMRHRVKPPTEHY